MQPFYADVVFPPRTSQAFTYRIPDSWHVPPTVGQWVLAPFGPRYKPGLIVSLTDNARQVTIPSSRIRELSKRLVASSQWDPAPTLILLAQWMADYYLAPVGACLALVHPPRPPFRSATRWTITPQGQHRLGTVRTGTATHALLTALAKRPKGLAPSTIDQLLAQPSTVLSRLKRQQWIQERQDWSELPFPHTPAPTLPAQARLAISDERPACPSWWERFQQHLQAGQCGEMLTGESPHERSSLLVNVIRHTTARQRTLLVITPNIGRAATLAAHLRHAAACPTGEFHSGLSETRRCQQWQAIKQGRYAVVVGTRSALFLPLPALGCVWVEHEEDGSYKEEASPHYHARDVARKRASLDNAVLVLHSPHPTLETVHHFAAGGEPDRTLPVPTRNTPPAIRLVNLQETAFGTIFSDALQQDMEHALAQGGGVIVYHNRKGFSSSLTCRDCGTAPQCPRCQVSFSLRQSQLLCPYCGQSEPMPTTCPSCSGTRLEPFGLGTERLEEALRRLYPQATVGRYDGNTIRSESAARRVSEQFSQGKIALLVGTQMLFHAFPLAPVRCLGVPYADAGLHMPDFRSSERVFHHLQQAVGLLTPGLPGSAVIQTRLPAHHVMEAVSQQQPALFYDQELDFRQRAGYPPFGHLIQLHVSGKEAAEAEEAATAWRRLLTAERARMIAGGETEQLQHDAILGPLPSHGPKPRGLHRYHLLVKFMDGTAGRTLVRRTLAPMTQQRIARRVRLGVNVDPWDVL